MEFWSEVLVGLIVTVVGGLILAIITRSLWWFGSTETHGTRRDSGGSAADVSAYAAAQITVNLGPTRSSPTPTSSPGEIALVGGIVVLTGLALLLQHFDIVVTLFVGLTGTLVVTVILAIIASCRLSLWNRAAALATARAVIGLAAAVGGAIGVSTFRYEGRSLEDVRIAAESVVLDPAPRGAFGDIVIAPIQRFLEVAFAPGAFSLIVMVFLAAALITASIVLALMAVVDWLAYLGLGVGTARWNWVQQAARRHDRASITDLLVHVVMSAAAVLCALGLPFLLLPAI